MTALNRIEQMTKATFWTPSIIPMDAFTIISASVKLGENPIGRFGTGLKYAIAVIIRHGGKIQLFVDDVEYEFYVHKKDFRGKEIQTIRMRKRHGLGKWLSSIQLPFTTHLGYNWSLWQAYRELESNTRDENGTTYLHAVEDEGLHGGTRIVVDCPNFVETIRTEEVFLQTAQLKLLHSASMVDIYDAPSKYLYMEGIRVYTLRYPARLTYNLKSKYVELTEDRTIGNLWSILYDLSVMFQKDVNDRGLLYRIMNVARDRANEATFETRELNFTYIKEASPTFRSVASTVMSGVYGGGSGTALSTWHAVEVNDQRMKAMGSVLLSKDDWLAISDMVDKHIEAEDMPDIQDVLHRFKDAIKKATS
jgi:hypothetical protein